MAYYHPDLTYVRDFQRHKENQISNSDYANGNFRRFLIDFRVARRLNSKREDRFSALLTLTLDWVKKTPKDVDGFVNSLKTTGLTRDEKEISLVSKILFLNSPQTIPPFDSNVKSAAWKIAHQRINSYHDYHTFFTEFKKANINEIKSRLTFVKDYLSVMESDFKGEIQDLEAIRLNRYVDKLLWVLGSSR